MGILNTGAAFRLYLKEEPLTTSVHEHIDSFANCIRTKKEAVSLRTGEKWRRVRKPHLVRNPTLH